MREWARIADVNFNRAREGLRVVEETARFIYNDPELALRVKDLRHRLSKLQGMFPGGGKALLDARDADGDCLAAVPEESPRADLGTPNWKRVQEATRVLEELARTVDPGLARELKEIRFKSYTLERDYQGRTRRGILLRSGLYAIGGCSDTRGRPLPEAVEEAARGGATVFQLREKDAPTARVLAMARELRQLTARLGVLFIINDCLDVALACGADGVHLGQDDLPLAEARRLAGPSLVIGVSTHSLEQAVAAEEGGADYVGFGPVYPTATKPDYQVVGLELVRAVTGRLRIPFVAIGGIDQHNAAEVVRAGADRLAVVRACFGAPDIEKAALALSRAIEVGVQAREGRAEAE